MKIGARAAWASLALFMFALAGEAAAMPLMQWSDLLSRPTDWPDAAVFGTLYGLGSLRAIAART